MAGTYQVPIDHSSNLNELPSAKLAYIQRKGLKTSAVACENARNGTKMTPIWQGHTKVNFFSIEVFAFWTKNLIASKQPAHAILNCCVISSKKVRVKTR